MRIQNGRLVTIENGTFACGYVDFEKGKITGFGDLADAPAYEGEVLDAKGGWIMPGFIDAHTHIGINEEIIGSPGSDCNEKSDPVTPDMRVVDGVKPHDGSIARAMRAGVTTAGVSPGSANVIGGQIAALKMRGDRVEDMILKAPAAMKFALGQNPKGVYGPRNKAPVTRMAVAAIMRKTLTRAQRYAAKLDAGEDVYDPELEALVPVVKGEIPVHFHAHQGDDILTAIRIAREFHLKYSIVHATGAGTVLKYMAEEAAIPLLGPLGLRVGKPEMRDLSFDVAGRLEKAGMEIAITTDHGVTPLWLLPTYAGLCVREGLSEEAAFRAITINGAKALGVADRVGSIALDKDADLVVFSGHPFHWLTKTEAVFIDGQRCK
ncbi:MAG: amidohydrolase [Clostridia bacterium]|nr:amidohydrolase [Clostridia bacterium]